MFPKAPLIWHPYILTIPTMAECLTPFCVRNKFTNQTTPVPCGKCPECLKRRVSGWSFRLMQEDKVSFSSHFVTLTYDTKHVPITKNGFMSLAKDDVQRFFKRLRKAEALISDNKIKYYLCGEYGGKTQRPHYHMLIFNVTKISLIEQSWNLGQCHYGLVSEASVGYTLKYMNKAKKIPMHRNDDRLQEFSLMSKGLGANYITDSILKYHTADLFNRMCLVVEGGKKVAMPRYYKDRIYLENERAQIASWGKQRAQTDLEKVKTKYGEHYDRDKVQADIDAFRKQNLQSQKRDKL